MENKTSKNVRIGILGGMGPMAGVELQRRIIALTPAEKDQDHLQVVCFTNPRVADRSLSLENNGGETYLRDIKSSLNILLATGVTQVVIPCNTAHARFAEIQTGFPLPILNMVELTVKELEKNYGTDAKVGLLATDGTIKEKVYERAGSGNFQWILPGTQEQSEVMKIIYEIKAGHAEKIGETIEALCNSLNAHGAEVILLGCTELSIYYEFLNSRGIPLVDPLQVTASYFANPIT